MIYSKAIFKHCFPKGMSLRYKIKNIPQYFREVKFLSKHGYEMYAHWSVDNWFTDTMKPILTHLADNTNSCPVGLDVYPKDATDEEKFEIWKGVICRMVYLLDFMDENSDKFDRYVWYTIEGDKLISVDNETFRKNCELKNITMQRAKKEFFELFSKYFYNLWD